MFCRWQVEVWRARRMMCGRQGDGRRMADEDTIVEERWIRMHREWLSMVQEPRGINICIPTALYFITIWGANTDDHRSHKAEPNSPTIRVYHQSRQPVLSQMFSSRRPSSIPLYFSIYPQLFARHEQPTRASFSQDTQCY